MKRNKLLECIGFKYIVNHSTNEIHRVKFLTENCFVYKMTSAGYATGWKIKRLLKQGYNGCRNCFKSEDKG